MSLFLVKGLFSSSPLVFYHPPVTATNLFRSEKIEKKNTGCDSHSPFTTKEFTIDKGRSLHPSSSSDAGGTVSSDTFYGFRLGRVHIPRTISIFPFSVPICREKRGWLSLFSHVCGYYFSDCVLDMENIATEDGNRVLCVGVCMWARKIQRERELEKECVEEEAGINGGRKVVRLLL